MMAAGIITDWTEIYLIAEDKSRKEAEKVEYLASSVSRWKNSDKIKNALTEANNTITNLKAQAFQDGKEHGQKLANEEREKERAESERTNEKQTKTIAKAVDYSDPKNQALKLNELVNQASDPGEALDALKVIISSQKADREAAKERKTVQVFLPLTCDACPLKQKAEKRRK